ncbi:MULTISPECIES: cupin domain-containing protein [unclassified Streptomyces]|uniref:cupin domain-containing protein n=1 Tax=unclassified Streptomyces TaxID=2593676 RepID=UPI002365D750|nr:MULTISPECIES: cupin domain-containing protein [unclassified Streptomyces]MDF3144289.1 cupin domain-containing protein [Streptomyces sp. T21Q-yed]WDF44310.1 cupin domain-containing protein [Streptomyces sp. T12]
MRTALRTAVTGAVAAATVLVAGPAQATPPGPGVTARTISQKTVGDTDYILREVTIPPGQATGWHYHDGPLYAFTQQGTLSHYNSSCASDGVYPQGSFIQEPAGPGNVHIGRNLGDTAVVLDVLYVLPHGAPFSQDAPNPGCPFQ